MDSALPPTGPHRHALHPNLPFPYRKQQDESLFNPAAWATFGPEFTQATARKWFDNHLHYEHARLWTQVKGAWNGNIDAFFNYAVHQTGYQPRTFGSASTATGETWAPNDPRRVSQGSTVVGSPNRTPIGSPLELRSPISWTGLTDPFAPSSGSSQHAMSPGTLSPFGSPTHGSQHPMSPQSIASSSSSRGDPFHYDTQFGGPLPNQPANQTHHPAAATHNPNTHYLASDGRWYPRQNQPASASSQATHNPSTHYLASDGRWYPRQQ